MEGVTPGSDKKAVWPWVELVILIIALATVAAWYYFGNSISSTPSQSISTPASTGTWKEGGGAVSGKYADADVVDLGNGKFRMYYSVEPEVAGNKLEIYSATSSDGKTWQQENGTRKTMATFPDAIKLPDGRFRIYYQNAGVIKSATSTDGLTFTDEPGTRIAKDETGFNLESVGAQTTTQLDDGTFVMAYRGTINIPYQGKDKVPNQNTQLYFYATSTDGLTFTKKGLALDSRNDTLNGLTDGGEWFKWSPSSDSEQVDLRLYFWTYAGVYHVNYKSGKFTTDPTFDFMNQKTDALNKFPQNPPGDPTLAKIGEQWFMYYGQHTKGIYYATYSN